MSNNLIKNVKEVDMKKWYKIKKMFKELVKNHSAVDEVCLWNINGELLLSEVRQDD